MKPDLKRIEAALHQIAGQTPRASDLRSRSGKPRSYSFKLQTGGNSTAAKTYAQVISEFKPQPIPLSHPQGKPVNLPKFQPLPAAATQPTPPRRTPAAIAHSTTVLNRLREIEATVLGWQEEMAELMTAIQSLYQAGPMVDGWLETATPAKAQQAAKLRHAEVDQLLDYVEEVWEKAPLGPVPTRYRLCGIDEVGQFWSRPCPLEQVRSVQMAIDRYQQLQQLLEQKHLLETRFKQLAETLAVLQHRMEEE